MDPFEIYGGGEQIEAADGLEMKRGKEALEMTQGFLCK